MWDEGHTRTKAQTKVRDVWLSNTTRGYMATYGGCMVYVALMNMCCMIVRFYQLGLVTGVRECKNFDN